MDNIGINLTSKSYDFIDNLDIDIENVVNQDIESFCDTLIKNNVFKDLESIKIYLYTKAINDIAQEYEMIPIEYLKTSLVDFKNPIEDEIYEKSSVVNDNLI